MNVSRPFAFRASRLLLPVLALLLLQVAACSSRAPRHRDAAMDTPEHHYETGMRLMDKSDNDARAAFDRALEIDPEHAPSLAGKGLIAARGGDKNRALDLTGAGRDEARSPADRLRVATTRLRTLTVLAKRGSLAPEDMMHEADTVYEDGLAVLEDEGGNAALGPLEAALRYEYGMAAMQGLELDKAEAAFKSVLDLGQGHEAEADRAWNRVQNARRAEPKSPIGKKIALMEATSRADMAALLVRELGVSRFADRTVAPAKATFATPQQTESERLSRPRYPGDALSHALTEDIKVVLDYGLRGLRPYPDGRFHPREAITRSEMALLFEDLLVRATGDRGLATGYIGTPSPFRDVSASHPAFNAIMLATSRGLVPGDARSGRFEPLGAVSGADAVLAIKRLGEVLSAP